uniref:Uncharacterized protein n=2 Tax=Caenorhabditis japonica TaxID=281687 RepID=A0A8R1IGF5_CAEJA
MNGASRKTGQICSRNRWHSTPLLRYHYQLYLTLITPKQHLPMYAEPSHFVPGRFHFDFLKQQLMETKFSINLESKKHDKGSVLTIPEWSGGPLDELLLLTDSRTTSILTKCAQHDKQQHTQWGMSFSP